MYIKIMSSIVIGIMMILIVIGYLGINNRKTDRSFDFLMGLFEFSYVISLYAIWH